MKEKEEKEENKGNEKIKPKKNDFVLQSKQSVIFGLVKDYSNPEHIPYKDKMFLTPTEKYRIYGKFPMRMVLDIFLIILTTFQIAMINVSTSSYTRAVERFFSEIFLQTESGYEVEFAKLKYLYTMDQIINHVRQSKDDYFNLHNYSIGNLTMEEPEDSKEIPVIINYLNKDENDVKNLINQYNMTQNDLWIFNETNSKSYIKNELLRIKSFTMNYKVRTFEPYDFGDYFECFVWNIEQIFSFEKRYHFAVSLKVSYSSCQDHSKDGNSFDYFIKGNYWIPTLIFIFSLLNFILTLRSIAINYQYYMNFKYRYSKRKIEIQRENKPPKKKTKWEMLRPKDQNKIMSKLNFLQAVGCLFQLFGSILTLYEGKDVIIITKYIVGIGAALGYLMLTKYLNFYYQFQTIFNTILKSVPNLILYFIGTLPIFISFIIFAIANFPYSERFYNFTRVILALFGMMNGDAILDIINDLIENSYFLGQIYVYFFNILFICVVINIFVSIIDEAFVNSKLKNQNHWIYSFVKKDQNKKEEEGIRATRGEMKMYDEMRRKNFIRETLNKNKDSNNQIINESELINLDDKITIRTKEKKETIKDIDMFTKVLQEAKKEIRNVKKEIDECKESKMKYELNQFLAKRVSNLEKLILEIQNNLKK